MSPLTFNGDSMRTWRNLGGRAKLHHFWQPSRRSFLPHWRPCWRVRNPLDSSRNLWRDPLTARSITRAVIFLDVSVTPINREDCWNES
ncbi:hypothetical protein TNCV_2299671 [Trichonephila clavipes]|nr:hypothetical protein TNCV_2299671 [Trichonephila clavipes]